MSEIEEIEEDGFIGYWEGDYLVAKGFREDVLIRLEFPKVPSYNRTAKTEKGAYHFVRAVCIDMGFQGWMQ